MPIGKTKAMQVRGENQKGTKTVGWLDRWGDQVMLPSSFR